MLLTSQQVSGAVIAKAMGYFQPPEAKAWVESEHPLCDVDVKHCVSEKSAAPYLPAGPRWVWCDIE